MPLTFSDGQVAATTATEILAGSTVGQDSLIGAMFANTNTTSETLVISFKRAGGTTRVIKSVVLATKEQLVISGLPFSVADSLLAHTTTAAKVDYVTCASGGPLAIYSVDANGGSKSGSSSIAGALALPDDLTLSNTAGTTFTAWDASAVPTLWANAPSVLNPDPFQFFQIWEDFMDPATSATSAVHVWTAVNDGATGTPVYQDAAGGIFNVVTAAADNDYSAYSSFHEPFKFASGKKLWFEARFKLTEATTNESAWWFGLTDTLTTGGFQANTAGPLASYDGALIWKDEATMTIDFETSNDGTQATTTAMATFVSNTWTRVGFYFDGTATTSVITPYYEVTGVDGAALVAGTAQNITLAGCAEMHVVYGVKAGPTAAAETLMIDWIRCVQLR